ncbi:Hypp4279 [Branchiostoma lanceolatum]|uniref:Hypp4279 protein n=1 Tax=Branchiostoma lanceolatum TaxID=7740 RepID=A0A8K0A721_BRALA|nr:Hypp4279 [Branchiostoma lanceolatum]
MALLADLERLTGDVNRLAERATVNNCSIARLATRINEINSVLVKDDSMRRVLTLDEAESHQRALREFHSLLEGAKDYLNIFSQDIHNVAPILGRENAKSDFDAFGDRLRRLLPRLLLALSDEQKTRIVEEFSETKMKKEDEEDARADLGDVGNTPVMPEYRNPVCAAQDTTPSISLEELNFNPIPENEITGSERSELGSVYKGAFRNTPGPLAIKKLHVPDGGPH